VCVRACVCVCVCVYACVYACMYVCINYVGAGSVSSVSIATRYGLDGPGIES
jgi:hypothetical protein